MRFKQRAVIEFWTAESLAPIEIHRNMQAVYGDSSYIDGALHVVVRTDREAAKSDLCDKQRV
jgi:hypothetical protein